jgi:hypothetical protein
MRVRFLSVRLIVIAAASVLVSVLAELDHIEEADALRATVRDLERRLRRAKAKTEDLVDAVRIGAREAALSTGIPPAVPAPKRDKRSKRPEVALLMLSDWHFGKATRSFNTEVAHQRLQRLAAKIAQIVEIERADHPVRECHVMLGGDMVENTGIFPGQAYEVDSTTFTQLFAAKLALETLLRELSAVFPHLEVWQQFGNHGRIGRKGDYPRTDNLDRLCYAMAQETSQKRVVWHPPVSWYTIVRVGEYRALLVHGDQIKSFGGNTPAFGILRKMNAWASGVIEPFTDAYMGHFHQSLVLPLAHGRGRVFVNPSIESDSEFAREFVAATGTPGQRLNFVDAERGRVTSERVLWVDD